MGASSGVVRETLPIINVAIEVEQVVDRHVGVHGVDERRTMTEEFINAVMGLSLISGPLESGRSRGDVTAMAFDGRMRVWLATQRRATITIDWSERDIYRSAPRAESLAARWQIDIHYAESSLPMRIVDDGGMISYAIAKTSFPTLPIREVRCGSVPLPLGEPWRKWSLGDAIIMDGWVASVAYWRRYKEPQATGSVHSSEPPIDEETARRLDDEGKSLSDAFERRTKSMVDIGADDLKTRIR